MSIDQFAMVEELARLVRDNIPCKHLVLAVEEALVNFLRGDFGDDGILELEPMNPYNRLLLHRLADIFGFAHESTGEGDERHLVFQRCPETAIPSILVSDILWQSNEPVTMDTAHQLLRRTDAPTVLITNIPSYQHSYEERQAAYLAARERIFADDIEMNESSRQRPRHVPVVARRMIAHALGKKADMLMPTGKAEGDCKQSDVHEAVECCPDSDDAERAEDKTTLCQGRALPQESIEEKLANIQVLQKGRRTNGIDSESMKKEHMGAAKRMLAQALGRPTAKPGHPLNEGGSR